MVGFDEFATKFGVLIVGEITNRTDASTGVLACVEHRDRCAGARQLVRSGEPGETCSSNDDR